MTRQREIPDKPPACVPQRKVMPVLEQLTSTVIEIDWKCKEDTDEFELNYRKVWKQREESEVGSIHMEMQAISSCSLNEPFLGTRIEYLAEFDMDEVGTEREIPWCSGVIQEICDGTWQIQGKGEGNAIWKMKQQRCFGMPFQMLKWKRIAQSSLLWQRSGMGIVSVHGG
jgi:hypothetical protein